MLFRKVDEVGSVHYDAGAVSYLVLTQRRSLVRKSDKEGGTQDFQKGQTEKEMELASPTIGFEDRVSTVMH